MEESQDQDDAERGASLPLGRMSAFWQPAHKLDTKLPSRLKLRERLKPFIPYIDKPNVRDNTKSAEAVFVQPDENWIDLDVIRSWLRACEQHHGACCQLVKHNDSSPVCSPTWLIDVERLCLVRAAPDMKYFALSYVWGNSPSTCALLANIHVLQKNDALGNLVQLPKTIAHVIHLTKLLEGRYLWVDRLCIIQDDGPDKQAQLDRMGDIYAEAFATFVAASGSDAREGLKGISGVTGRRYFSGRFGNFFLQDPESQPGSDFNYGNINCNSSVQPDMKDAFNRPWELGPTPFERVNDCNFSIQPHTDDWEEMFDKTGEVDSDCLMPETFHSEFEITVFSEDTPTDLNSHTTGEILVEQAQSLMESKWYSRGWTFQEHMFSCRKIIFQDETVNWECLSAAWHEAQGPVDDHPRQQLDKQPILGSLSFDSTPWPDFYRFARLVSLYNQRHFSYPEDVMDAFAGVISMLSRSFTGGFVTGLPQMLFDSALLWQPYTPIYRRTRRGEQEACLPSWSWIGWHGDISSQSWRSGYDYIRKNPDEYYEKDTSIWQPISWRTRSTIRWFRIDEAGEKQPINVTSQQYRDHCSDFTEALPAGWTRHHCHISGKQFFRHERDQSQEFWYPIPLGDLADSRPRHISTKYLWCWTKRAFLHVGDSFRNQVATKCLCVDLVDQEQNWVGALRYHFGGWKGMDLMYRGHELIELSAGSVLDQETEEVSIDEWFRPGCPRFTGKYEFYNVMAIKWDGSIAYRQAIGRVVKTAWERLATEEIEITLK